MRSTLALILALGASSRLVAQTTAAGPQPERLMIGPTEYLLAPRPFPVDVPANASSLEQIQARKLAPRTWGMSHALPCRAVMTVDTAGWVPLKGGSGAGPAALPSAFALDTTFLSYHGGLRWAADGMSLSIENGWWGVSYERAGYLTACRVKVRAGEYLVDEARTVTGYAFTAIPLDSTWAPSEMITGEAATEENLRILWTAFVSMVPPRCRYMTGAPVRDPTAPGC